MRLNFCVFIVFLTFAFDLKASALPKDSAIIVRLTHVATQSEKAKIEIAGFHRIEYLNPEKNLLQLFYRPAYMKAETALAKAQAFDFVDLVQEDFRISFRTTTPNDPRYADQWHLPLIRADKAWDFSRTGVNRRGDTIVIAVVDDGLHTNHPDFQGNIWINYADIPDNGIDDDGNAYIDDTYGWNFQSNNKDISDSGYYKAKHGTPVAGIIGANTNNSIGISGIMWKCKLMIVNVADTGDFPETFQSDVIRAYSYILHQRKLYNSTNGQKGAFVVAENSSWGADNKRPNQAPLWCAFYDTLGKYGVMNIGATTNSQKDIDVSGDLPSLCPSDHLIVVGASTLFDNYGGCGYSTLNVDLSAPGYNIFTAAPYIKENIQTGNVYRSGYSGTSFAAPMVTAAIGVLHAYACERVLDSIKLNPAKANLILRKMILEGVDQVPALIGKSATAGRLNILKSIEILNDYCAGNVGVDQLLMQNQFSVYPNPFQAGKVRIEGSTDILKVEMYDAEGRLMTTSFSDGQLETGALSTGLYTIRIFTSNGIATVKVICQ